MATIKVGGSWKLPGIAQHHLKANICDILEVTETHQIQEKRLLTNYTHIGEPAPHETGYPREGASFIFKSLLKSKLYYLYATSHYQAKPVTQIRT